MEEFVTGDLKRLGSFERFLEAAVAGRAGVPGGSQSDASTLDESAELSSLRSLLCSMLTVKPSERADGMFFLWQAKLGVVANHGHLYEDCGDFGN